MTDIETAPGNQAGSTSRCCFGIIKSVPERREHAPEELARDILAAEAFAVPAPDPRLRHQVVLPSDPAGIVEPHDILAAEEFAMPAPDPSAAVPHGGRLGAVRRTSWAGLAGAAAALLLWLRRRS
jgi:hypothetical protein